MDILKERKTSEAKMVNLFIWFSTIFLSISWTSSFTATRIVPHAFVSSGGSYKRQIQNLQDRQGLSKSKLSSYSPHYRKHHDCCFRTSSTTIIRTYMKKRRHELKIQLSKSSLETRAEDKQNGSTIDGNNKSNNFPDQNLKNDENDNVVTHKEHIHNDENDLNFNLSLAYQEQLTKQNSNNGIENETTSKANDQDYNNEKPSNDVEDNDKEQQSTNNEKKNDWYDWSTPASSLGSLLLKRKKIEEEEIKKKIENLTSSPSPSSSNMDNQDNDDNDDKTNGESSQRDEEDDNLMILFQDEINIDGLDFNGKDITEVQKEIDQTIKTLASEAEETIVSFIDLTKGRIDSSSGSKDERGKSSENEEDLSSEGLDEELVREVDESVNMLTSSQQNLMKDIEVLITPATKTNQVQQQQQQQTEVDPSIKLPLSGPGHTARIERDMKQLAVSIASTVEDAQQWQTYTEDGGGLLPLLECIRDGAKEIENGPWEKNLYYDEGMTSLVEKREEAFAAACAACKTLRDLCSISKPFASMITDSILRANSVWSDPVTHKDGQITLDGGLISNLVTLLRFSQQADNLTNPKSTKQKLRAFRNGGVQRLGNRRQKRDARKRCGLYVTQLLLEMSFTSDKAVDVFRATSGLTETVLGCSSYAQAERLRRRWIRYPMEVAKRIMSSEVGTSEERPFLAAASVNSGMSGQTQGSANQLLAAIGHNVWYPKTAGQKGLRILCLDGGGTRGITAISSMRSIVNAIGGIEVCDAFDMIVGTSTGAIIAFLVGLRRESSAQARKRYDRLISRVFVKSALSTPMLLFTTATYDETPFNNVVGEIMRDNSMLSSRADPRVPLVFAISSKMSSTPTQICLFRNYNYGGGEMNDAFVMDPLEAKEELGVELEDDIYEMSGMLSYDGDERIKSPRTGASRHPGSFRVLQRAALRATTAAPTVFKPVLMGGELYCDGGIVASNPAAVAIHEARTIYPNVPIELVVSCGTGAFEEEKSAPRIGWDGIIGQIVNSATDGEQVHHILEDILGGQGSTTKLGRSSVSKTKYFRFQPVIGTSDTFPIDGTDPIKLEELSQITTDYMNEPEQMQKLNEIVDILKGNTGWKRKLLSKIGITK